MLGQRRRRWPNINPILAECSVLAGTNINVNYVMSNSSNCVFIKKQLRVFALTLQDACKLSETGCPVHLTALNE